MEITMAQMYWLVKLDSIIGLFVIISVVLLIVSFFLGFYLDEKNKSIKPIFFLIGVGLLFLVSAFMTPSTKQMAAIIVVPKIINNQRVQEFPEKLIDLGYEWLDEISPKKNNEGE